MSRHLTDSWKSGLMLKCFLESASLELSLSMNSSILSEKRLSVGLRFLVFYKVLKLSNGDSGGRMFIHGLSLRI